MEALQPRSKTVYNDGDDPVLDDADHADRDDDVPYVLVRMHE